jgi:multisubunit Na+/H+ antiporter MnhE subunit
MQEKKSIIKDRRDIGTVVGMIVCLAIAFAITAKQISIAAIIISIIVGAIVGRLAGYFVKRKLSNVKFKTRTVLYDFYSSYLKIVDRYTTKLKHDVNSNRIILEAVCHDLL